MVQSTALKMLGLSSPPIAIAFRDSPPPGVEKRNGDAVPAGCVFWREAMDGKSFYTVPTDHYNCAVGCHTHGIPLPPERGAQLQDTVTFMVMNKYLEMSEVPGIPVLDRAPRYICYAPAEDAALDADLILIAAKPKAAMFLYEAALRAGAGNALASALGRPACAVLPFTQKSAAASASFGCMGNRTFTGLPEEELYIAIPARHWPEVLAKLAEIGEANRTMTAYYEEQAKF
ncbi:MAG: DUF169 domain-containing protein [Bryobacteraceae bacterium]